MKSFLNSLKFSASWFKHGSIIGKHVFVFVDLANHVESEFGDIMANATSSVILYKCCIHKQYFFFSLTSLYFSIVWLDKNPVGENS